MKPARRTASLAACFLALALRGAPVAAELPPELASPLRDAEIPESAVGLALYRLDGAPLWRHQAEQAFNPASVMKLVTTLAALDTLGPAHTFETRVWLDGALADGVLDGNLVIEGGGDPGLTPERLWALLRQVVARGVREIRGAILIDGGAFTIPPVDPGAFDGAPLRPYNAQPAALLVNYNVVELQLAPTPQGGIEARLYPPMPGWSLDNRLQAASGPCAGWREAFSPRVEAPTEQTPPARRLVLQGAYPAACGHNTLPLNLDTPEATAGAWIAQLWREAGGSLRDGVRAGRRGTDARLELSHASPPLAVLARDINVHSNNVMAKMLLLDLARARYPAPASWGLAAQATRDALRTHGLALEGLTIDNGAGLSRTARISPAGMAELLAWASQRPAFFAFAASLPNAGLEGTLKSRLLDVQGLAMLKTGSLADARNLAGYVRGPDGQWRILVLFINHARAPFAAAAQDAAALWAARWQPAEAAAP